MIRLMILSLALSASVLADPQLFATVRAAGADANIYHTRTDAHGTLRLALALREPPSMQPLAALAIGDAVAGAYVNIELSPKAGPALVGLHRSLQRRGPLWTFSPAIRELGVSNALNDGPVDGLSLHRLRNLVAASVRGTIQSTSDFHLEVLEFVGRKFAVLVRFDGPSTLTWCTLDTHADTLPCAVVLECGVSKPKLLSELPELLARLIATSSASLVIATDRGLAIRQSDRTWIALEPGFVPAAARVALPQLVGAPSWFELLDRDGWPVTPGAGRVRLDRGGTNLVDRHLGIVAYPRDGAGPRDPLLDLLVAAPVQAAGS